MTSPKAEPRQHHYLPRFYLEGFCDPVVQKRGGKSVIWVYEKGRPIRRSTPKNEARERDFYAVKVEGERDIRVERWLSLVEDNTAPIIRRLEDERYPLTEDDRMWLSLFVGTMHLRTPSGREFLDSRIGPGVNRMLIEAAKDKDLFASTCHKFDPLAGSNYNLEEVRAEILAGKVGNLHENEVFKLAGIIEVGQMEANVLFELDWQIVRSDGSEFFLTTDHPVVTGLFDESQRTARFHMGVNYPGVDNGFPLSRTLWLRMKRDIERGPCRISSRGVRMINKAAMLNAYRRVYAAESSVRIQKLFDRKGSTASIETFRPMWEGKEI